MGLREQRLNRIGTATIVSLIVGGLAFAAARAEGFKASKVKLHDSGIWLVKADVIGRFNHDLQKVDTQSATFANNLDLQQVDSTVIVTTKVPPVMHRYNVALNGVDGAINGTPLPPDAIVSIGGDNGALLDAKTGRLWFTSGEALAGVKSADNDGFVQLDGAKQLVVGTDGTAHVYAPDTGHLWTMRQIIKSSAGAAQDPATPSTIANVPASAAVAVSVPDSVPQTTQPKPKLIKNVAGDMPMTTAGDRVLFLDAPDGAVVLDDGTSIKVNGLDAQSKLQQPSSDRTHAVVSTSASLMLVDLVSHAVKTLGKGNEGDTAGDGSPLNPVWLNGCAYGAWKTHVARYCENLKLSEVAPTNSEVPLEFRTNRGLVALNYVSGAALDMSDDGPILPLSNDWDSALKPDTKDKKQQSQTEASDQTDACVFDPAKANTAPIAVPDTFGVRRTDPTILDVLSGVGSANGTPDSDKECDALTIDLPKELSDNGGVLPNDGGTLAVIKNGRQLQYSPPAADKHPAGPITFTYELSDGRTTPSPTTTVTLNFVEEGQNNPPTPQPDATSVAQGKTVQLNVLANDFDPDGDSLVVTNASILDVSGAAVGVNGPDGDALVWQANGRLTYRAPAAVTKTEKISYEVSDGHGGTAKAEVDVAVIPGGGGQNKPPNTINDTVIGLAGQNLSVNVLDNDSDPNNDVLRLTKLVPVDASTPNVAKWDGASGIVSLDSAVQGVYNYAYQVDDGNGGNAWGRVRFTVLAAGQNHAPVAVRDDAVVTQGRATLIDVLGNDTDLDGDVMMVTAIAPGVNADGVLSSDALSVEVLDHRILRVTTKSAAEPLQGYKFNYTITDGQASSSAVVTVRIAAPGPGQAPVTKPDEAHVHLGGVVGIPVLANDYDPDGDPIVIVPGSAKITGADSADQGQLFIESDLVVYVAPSSKTRNTGFTVNAEYQVSDGQHIQRETILINVVDLTENQAPAPSDLLIRVYTNEQNVQIPLPRFGLDPDGDPVQILSRIPDPTRDAKGDDAYDAKKAVFTYNAGDVPGQDKFSYEISDSPASGESKTGHITVRVTVAKRGDNAPPVAVDDVFEVKAGQTTALAVLANDTDPDGDAISFAPGSPVDQPTTGGTVDVTTADPTHVAFTATGADKSTADFHYHIVDSQGNGAVGSAHVKITTDGPKNKPPVAKDDPQPAARQGQVLMIDVLANDKDPEGDALSVQCPVASESFCKTVDNVTSADGKVRQGLQVTMGTTSLSFSYLLSDAAHPDEASGASRAVVQVPFLAPAKDVPPTCLPLTKDVAATDPESVQVTIDIAAQCSDPDTGDHVVIAPDTKPRVTRGSEAFVSTDLKWEGSSFTFARHLEFSGEVAIEYTVQDNAKAGATGTILLRIVGHVNTKPTATKVDRTIEAGATAVTINLKGTAVTDPDPGDNDLLQFAGGSSPDAKFLTSALSSGGVLTVAAPDETVVTDQTGPKTLTIDYTVNDTHGGETKGSVGITIKPSNKPGPNAQDDVMPTVKQGSSGTVNVLANDLPGDPTLAKLEVTTPTVQATGKSGPAGTAHIDAAGNAVFTPNPGFHGTAVFSYIVQDQRHSPTKQGHANVTVDVQDKPDKPAQPSVGAQQTTAADVTFTDSPDNGSPITQYVISWNGGKKDCGPAAGHCIIPGLTNGTAYQFQVTAINGVGPSDASDLSQPYTPDQVPDQPPQPKADWDDKTATVTWAGIVNPGSPLVGVRIDVSPPDVASFTAGGDAAGSHQFLGLNNGTPYTFTITAINSAKPNGQSKPSSASIPVVPAGNPGPVGTPSLVKGDGQVTASWAPADPNGDPAGLTYTVKLLNNGTVEQVVGPMTATSKTIQATNGQTYTVIVETNNKYTSKTAKPVVSPPSLPIVPSGHPKAPATLAVTQNQDGALKLHIGATDNNGNHLDHYTVTASNGTSKTFPADAAGAAADVVYPGLTNGTAYTFTVTAHNDNGDGASTSSSVGGTPFGTPQAPTVTCSHNGSFITCAWNINGINGPAPAATTVSMDDGFASTAASGTHTTVSLPYSTTRVMTVKVCNNGGSVAPGGTTNPCTSASAQDTSGAAPTPHINCNQNGKTIDCTWNITGLVGSDPHTSTVDSNGQVIDTRDSGSWNSGDIGYSTTRTVTFRVCNSSGQCPNPAVAIATTMAKPNPVVSTSKGALYKGANCTGTCYYFTMNVSNFSPGNHQFRCFDGQLITTPVSSKVYSGTMLVDPNGNGSVVMPTTSPYCAAATSAEAGMQVLEGGSWISDSSSW